MAAGTRTVRGTTTLTLIQRLDDGSVHARAWHIPDHIARGMAAVLGGPDVESVTGAAAVAAGSELVRESGQYTEVLGTHGGGRRG